MSPVNCYTVPGNSSRFIPFVAPAGIILELDYSHVLGIKRYTLDRAHGMNINARRLVASAVPVGYAEGVE